MLLLLLAAAVSGAACPATVGGVRLSGGTVYDGPVAENAILRPDDDRRVRGGSVSTWQVDYVYDAGRQVFLTCSYPHRPDRVVRIVQRVRLCTYAERGRARALACR